jgi:AbrB family looped-hinge helix DNA binding protein
MVAPITSEMRAEMERQVVGLETKSAKIRALGKSGFTRSEIARFLDIRYQHVRNVLVQEEAKSVPGGNETLQDTDDGSTWTRLGPGGRIVIPASMRDALGLSVGDDLQVVLDGKEIRVVPRSVVVERVQELVARYVPEGVSLVDELIKERRREAAREDERG